MTSLVGLAFTLALIWALGYVLVLNLAPQSITPGAQRAAVALLLGLCVTGIVLIVPVSMIHNAVWFDRSIRWTVPIVVAAGGLVLVVRFCHRASASHVTISWPRMSVLSVTRIIAPWTSAAVLVIGAAVLVAQRPSPGPTIEMYGARSGDRIRVSVVSSVRHQALIVVIRDQFSVKRVTLPSDSGTRSSGTVTARVHGNAWIGLYRATDTMAASHPLRWLAFPAPRQVP